MMNKKYFKFSVYVLPLLVCLFLLSVVSAQAATIKYTPNITIPDSDFISGKSIDITADTLAIYIREVYRYGGVIAGAFAMFMLVYASWQWLMAGGNASKVTMAKETINTTLIGLAFLFGGYLLLTQISVNLVDFKPLVIKEPVFAPSITCQNFDASKTCAAYIDQSDCDNNACFNQNGFKEVCFYNTVSGSGGERGCYKLSSGLKACDKNIECNFDLNGDGSSDYCCADEPFQYDACYLISEASQAPRVGCGSD